MTGEPPVSTKEMLCRAIRAGDVSAFFALMDYLEENPCSIGWLDSDYILSRIKASDNTFGMRAIGIVNVLLYVCDMKEEQNLMARKIVEAMP